MGLRGMGRALPAGRATSVLLPVPPSTGRMNDESHEWLRRVGCPTPLSPHRMRRGSGGAVGDARTVDRCRKAAEGEEDISRAWRLAGVWLFPAALQRK